MTSVLSRCTLLKNLFTPIISALRTTSGSSGDFVYIGENRVKELLNWDSLYPAIETSLRCQSENKVQQPARNLIKVINSDNHLYTMPGYLDDQNFGSLACKMVTAFPKNYEKGIPGVSSNVLLFDRETGVLKAVVSATELTKFRTAVASVVATKHLFKKPAQKGLILAVFGAGTQGESHAESFNHFFDLKEVRISDNTIVQDKAGQLAEKLNLKFKSTIFRRVKSEEEAVKDADLIVTTTFVMKPFLLAKWVKEEVHINAVGTNGIMLHPTELEESLYLNGDVYTDCLQQLKEEQPDMFKKKWNVIGEVGEIISGKKKTTGNKLTIFQSLGMVVEDCAAARLIYEMHTKGQDKIENKVEKAIK